MELTPDAVTDIYRACAAEDGEVEVHGVVHVARLSRVALDEHAEQIRDLLGQLHPTFRVDGGGGWSFLNMCQNAEGEQWTGMHLTMEMLMVLGLGIGRVTLLMERELWPALPGGVPYLSVDVR